MIEGRYSRRAAAGLAAGALGAVATFAIGRRGGVARENVPLAQTGTPAPNQAVEHPMGADEAVIRIEYVGGLMLLEARLTQLPLAALYGDGLLLTAGPQIMIFPPPALPNLRQMRLAEEGIQAVLAEAEAAGLIGDERRFDNPLIADAPYTAIIVEAAGRTTRTALYALGSDNPEWTDEERAAVAAIQAFVGRFVDPVSWLPASAIAAGDEPYPIERLQVLAQLYDQAGLDPNDPSLDQPAIDWPIDTPISSFESMGSLPGSPASLSCAVLSGADASAVVEAAADANSLTPWVDEEQEWLLWLRPVLPDEAGCPPLEADPNIIPQPEATPA
jgi:hypothetical protein